MLRKDRTHSRGGGVCVFVSRNLHVSQVVLSDTYSELEFICFDLLCGKTKLRFVVINRPPNSDGVAEKYDDLLLDCIAQYATLEQTNIITGDQPKD